MGSLSIRIGLGWAKSHSFATGQCPVMKYHRDLMQAILSDRAQIAKAVNAKVISLDEAPKGYDDFDKGESVKFVINPNGLIYELDGSKVDAAARRVDLLDQHAHRVAEPDPLARVRGDEHRLDVVELPPVAAQSAHAQQALEAVEGDERAGADQARDLAVELLLQASFEQPPFEQERARDAVGLAFDRHRVALARRAPVARRPRGRTHGPSLRRRRSRSAAHGGRSGPGSGGSAT